MFYKALNGILNSIWGKNRLGLGYVNLDRFIMVAVLTVYR